MPTSDPHQIPVVLAELVRLDPVSVVDLGAGYGKYGPLIREYVDDWGPFGTELTAVEGHLPYARRAHLNYDAYDTVYHGTIEGWVEQQEKLKTQPYDVGLLVDVLEHWDKSEGAAILNRLCSVCRRMVVATPREPAEQDAPYGNPLDTHRAQWREQDFAQFDVERRLACDDQLVLTLRGWMT